MSLKLSLPNGKIVYMAKGRKWTEDDLITAVNSSLSIRQVIKALGLVPAGGNYTQVKRYINELDLDTSHFKGQGWSKNLKVQRRKPKPLDEILTKNSRYQSYKLKKRLFKAKLKKPVCEECGWAKCSEDGRIPVELDHVNGDRFDNRLENLRILCPNCHSLKSTHRGRNINKG